MLGDDQRLRNARNAIGKDGYQSRPGRKASHWERGKACVRPAIDGIDREENNLAVVEAAQLHDRVIARGILGVAAGSLRDALKKQAGEPETVARYES